MGYTGGASKNPSYHDLRDHSEAVQIDFDPSRTSYRELLNVFWKSHDPTRNSWSRQYRNAIFYHSELQRKVATETRDHRTSERDGRIATAIEPYSGFTLAEDYHQKFRLQQDPVLTEEYDTIYPEMKDFVNSPAVSRVNGYLGGYGTAAQLRKEIDSLGLSPEGRKRLLESVPFRNR